MSFFRSVIAPRMIDFAMTRPFWTDYRRRVLAPAAGEVLEIGFGTGVNLDFYPDAVRRLTVVEPDPAMLARARARVLGYPRPLVVVAGAAEALPFDDGAFDTVVSTLTLCSVSDPERALAEVRRVLKPGGRYLYLEHGLADEAAIGRWQNRLNGIWPRLACGCNLNRDMSALIGGAGFGAVEMTEAYAPGLPRISGLLTEGRADAA